MIKDIFIKETKGKGKGVFALRSFKKGEFIFRFKKGKIVKRKDISKLSKEDQEHLNEIIDKDTYEIQRPPERFLNHSCDSNAIAKGRTLFALKLIRKGEEITVDYRINAHDKQKLKCKCGSKNCTGIVILDFFSLSEKLQKKYLLYAPKFIQEEYNKRHKESRN